MSKRLPLATLPSGSLAMTPFVKRRRLMYAACLGIPQIISWILRALSFLLKPQKAFFCPWMMAEGEAQRRARQFLSLMSRRSSLHTQIGENSTW